MNINIFLRPMFSKPKFRWFLVAVWTSLVLVALLTPGRHARAGDLSFSNFLATFFSFEMSGHDKIEATVHSFFFAVLSAIWYWALVNYYSSRIALIRSITICVVLGVSTEITQYFIGRGSVLIDLLANLLGMFFSVGMIMIMIKLQFMRKSL